jgi:hypothetical protein
LEVVEDLAARNANLEAKDNYGMAPIALAASRRQGEVVKDLAARNANLEAKDNYGVTATTTSMTSLACSDIDFKTVYPDGSPCWHYSTNHCGNHDVQDFFVFIGMQ